MTAAEFQQGLHHVRAEIHNGRRTAPEVAVAVQTLYETPFIRMEEELRARAAGVEFSSELVSEALEDPFAMRVEKLAELAFLLARWANPEAALQTGLFLGSRLSHLQAFDASQHVLERTAELARRLSSPVHFLARCLAVRALVEAGQFAAADQAFEELAPETLEQLGVEALSLWMLGARAATEIHHATTAEARANVAFERYQRGDAKRRTLDLSLGLISDVPAAHVYCIRGSAARLSGDRLRAIVCFQEGRLEALRENDPRGAAWCLSEVGIAWQQLCAFDRASTILQRAAEEAEALGELEAAARWRPGTPQELDERLDLSGFNGLAYAVARLQAHEAPDEEAEQVIKAVIAESTEQGGAAWEAAARNLLASCYLRRRQWARAIAAQRAAIAIAVSNTDRLMALTFRANLANILVRANRFADAQAEASAVLAEAFEWRATLSSSEARQALADSIANAYEVCVLIASERWITHDGERPPDPQALLALSRDGRGINFDRWLGLLAYAHEATDRALIELIRATVGREITLEWAAQGGQILKEALTQQAMARESLRSNQFPVQGTAIPLETLASECLNTGERRVVLDLNTIEAGIAYVVLRQQMSPVAGLIPWTGRERLAWMHDWSALCERALVVGSDESAAVRSAYSELIDRFATPLLAAADVDAPDTCHLIVVPHAELFGLPLWSLAHVAPHLRISIVPTLRAVGILGRRLPPPVRGRGIKLGDVTSSLHHVSLELNALTDYEFVPPDVDAFIAASRQASAIHFAGHGELSSENAYENGIVLGGTISPPDTVPSSWHKCVRLTVPGIVQRIFLEAGDLVVLSACSIGAPRLHAASEFTSLPAAFLLAGARNVVAAAWPVHDGATAWMMREFYRTVESAPIHVALAAARQALQNVTRETLLATLGPDYPLPPGPHPFASPVYSDAFVHFGVQ
jgi:hypothetical protein